eukprot:gb/GECG01008428.1/.p1 GENE.gb/GECG01008428.1/~~gb/GECG01008428.1/.p1  ORF type:complete len:3052 (+),score=344.37 gb/GECG01008428.1/:1-9156(+)
MMRQEMVSLPSNLNRPSYLSLIKVRNAKRDIRLGYHFLKGSSVFLGKETPGITVSLEEAAVKEGSNVVNTWSLTPNENRKWNRAQSLVLALSVGAQVPFDLCNPESAFVLGTNRRGILQPGRLSFQIRTRLSEDESYSVDDLFLGSFTVSLEAGTAGCSNTTRRVFTNPLAAPRLLVGLRNIVARASLGKSTRSVPVPSADSAPYAVRLTKPPLVHVSLFDLKVLSHFKIDMGEDSGTRRIQVSWEFNITHAEESQESLILCYEFSLVGTAARMGFPVPRDLTLSRECTRVSSGAGWLSTVASVPLEAESGAYRVEVRAQEVGALKLASEQNTVVQSSDLVEIRHRELPFNSVPWVGSILSSQDLVFEVVSANSSVAKGPVIVEVQETNHTSAAYSKFGISQANVAEGEIPTIGGDTSDQVIPLTPFPETVERQLHHKGLFGHFARVSPVQIASSKDSGPVSILARESKLRIKAIGNSRAGNGGDFTVKLFGEGFNLYSAKRIRTCIRSSVGERSFQLPADKMYIGSETVLYARFDLNGLTPGTYDIQVWATSANTTDGSYVFKEENIIEDALFRNGLQVVKNETIKSGAKLNCSIEAPSQVDRRNDYVKGSLVCENRGLQDEPLPMLQLDSNGNNLGESVEDMDSGEQISLVLLMHEAFGPPGILRPGGVARRRFYVASPWRDGANRNQLPLSAIRLDTMIPGPPIEWNEIASVFPSYREDFLGNESLAWFGTHMKSLHDSLRAFTFVYPELRAPETHSSIMTDLMFLPYLSLMATESRYMEEAELPHIGNFSGCLDYSGGSSLESVASCLRRIPRTTQFAEQNTRLNLVSKGILDPTIPTYVGIHGLWDTEDEMLELLEHYVEPYHLLSGYKVNLISVDWREITRDPLYYDAAALTGEVAKIVVQKLHQMGVSPEQTHFIGDNLGARVALKAACGMGSEGAAQVVAINPLTTGFSEPSSSLSRFQQCIGEVVYLKTFADVFTYEEDDDIAFSSLPRHSIVFNPRLPLQPGCRTDICNLKNGITRLKNATCGIPTSSVVDCVDHETPKWASRILDIIYEDSAPVDGGRRMLSSTRHMEDASGTQKKTATDTGGEAVCDSMLSFFSTKTELEKEIGSEANEIRKDRESRRQEDRKSRRRRSRRSSGGKTNLKAIAFDCLSRDPCFFKNLLSNCGITDDGWWSTFSALGDLVTGGCDKFNNYLENSAGCIAQSALKKMGMKMISRTVTALCPLYYKPFCYGAVQLIDKLVEYHDEVEQGLKAIEESLDEEKGESSKVELKREKEERLKNEEGEFVPATKRTEGVAPFDPNDIVGPQGIGSLRWVSHEHAPTYRIRFENSEEKASAPAKNVNVRVHMNGTGLFLPSLRIRKYGFGNKQFDEQYPSSTVHRRLTYEDDWPLDPSFVNGLHVDVSGGADISKEEFFFTFRSIDKQTGASPLGPMNGFLPPNYNDTGVGEGFVEFSIQTREIPPLETEFEISVSAAIVFDEEEPIATAPWTNLVDASSPVSSLLVRGPEAPQTGLNASTLNSSRTLSSWTSGETRLPSDTQQVVLYIRTSDRGSGLSWVDIMGVPVCENEQTLDRVSDEPHHIIKVEEEGLAIFDMKRLEVGEGCSWQLFSIARDRVGHTERLPGAKFVRLVLEEASSCPCDCSLRNRGGITALDFDEGFLLEQMEEDDIGGKCVAGVCSCFHEFFGTSCSKFTPAAKKPRLRSFSESKSSNTVTIRESSVLRLDVLLASRWPDREQTSLIVGYRGLPEGFTPEAAVSHFMGIEQISQNSAKILAAEDRRRTDSVISEMSFTPPSHWAGNFSLILEGHSRRENTTIFATSMEELVVEVESVPDEPWLNIGPSTDFDTQALPAQSIMKPPIVTYAPEELHVAAAEGQKLYVPLNASLRDKDGSEALFVYVEMEYSGMEEWMTAENFIIETNSSSGNTTLAWKSFYSETSMLGVWLAPKPYVSGRIQARFKAQAMELDTGEVAENHWLRTLILHIEPTATAARISSSMSDSVLEGLPNLPHELAGEVQFPDQDGSETHCLLFQELPPSVDIIDRHGGHSLILGNEDDNETSRGSILNVPLNSNVHPCSSFLQRVSEENVRVYTHRLDSTDSTEDVAMMSLDRFALVDTGGLDRNFTLNLSAFSYEKENGDLNLVSVSIPINIRTIVPTITALDKLKEDLPAPIRVTLPEVPSEFVQVLLILSLPTGQYSFDNLTITNLPHATKCSGETNIEGCMMVPYRDFVRSINGEVSVRLPVDSSSPLCMSVNVKFAIDQFTHESSSRECNDVIPVPDKPQLSFTSATHNLTHADDPAVVHAREDEVIQLGLEYSLTDISGSEKLLPYLCVGGLQNSRATLDLALLTPVPSCADYDAAINLQQLNQSAGVVKLMPKDNWHGVATLEFVLSSMEKETVDTASTTLRLEAKVSALPDAPRLSILGNRAETNESSALTIPLDIQLTDYDGSESLHLSVVSEDMSFKLSQSSIPGSVISEDGSSLVASTSSIGKSRNVTLEIRPPDYVSGTFSVFVTGYTEESINLKRSDIINSEAISAFVFPVANRPSFSFARPGSVLTTEQFQVVSLDFSAELQDTDGSETLGVVFSELPAGTECSILELNSSTLIPSKKGSSPSSVLEHAKQSSVFIAEEEELHLVVGKTKGELTLQLYFPESFYGKIQIASYSYAVESSSVSERRIAYSTAETKEVEVLFVDTTPPSDGRIMTVSTSWSSSEPNVSVVLLPYKEDIDGYSSRDMSPFMAQEVGIGLHPGSANLTGWIPVEFHTTDPVHVEMPGAPIGLGGHLFVTLQARNTFGLFSNTTYSYRLGSTSTGILDSSTRREINLGGALVFSDQGDRAPLELAISFSTDALPAPGALQIEEAGSVASQNKLPQQYEALGYQFAVQLLAAENDVIGNVTMQPQSPIEMSIEWNEKMNIPGSSVMVLNYDQASRTWRSAESWCPSSEPQAMYRPTSSVLQWKQCHFTLFAIVQSKDQSTSSGSSQSSMSDLAYTMIGMSVAIVALVGAALVFFLLRNRQQKVDNGATGPMRSKASVTPDGAVDEVTVEHA